MAVGCFFSAAPTAQNSPELHFFYKFSYTIICSKLCAIFSPGVRSPDAKRDRCHPRCIHLQVIEIQHEFCNNNNMPVLSVLSRVLGIFILVTFRWVLTYALIHVSWVGKFTVYNWRFTQNEKKWNPDKKIYFLTSLMLNLLDS